LRFVPGTAIYQYDFIAQTRVFRHRFSKKKILSALPTPPLRGTVRAA
jgi:hypothetical protein